jgi:hypothetical protein
MNRRVGSYLLLGLATLGIAMAGVPFAGYFSSKNAAPRSLTVKTDDLAAGEFKVVDTARRRLYVIRTTDDRIVVLAVPSRNGDVLMPDFQWWHPLGPCHDFGPSEDRKIAENRKITSRSRFGCRDGNPVFAWAQPYWIWDAEGRALGPPENRFGDMPRVRFERFPTYIVLEEPDAAAPPTPPL